MPAESLKRFNLLVSAAVAALVPTVVWAQQAPSTGSEHNEGIQEIIVTAQRRSQSIQDVPVAVTAANAETLSAKGITNIDNISAISPSITFRVANTAASTANLQIRGIGTVGSARTFEGAVGVFIDGVYRTRSGQALTNFLDIDEIQVLRGPQGTLFGKNTSAGAVLVNSVAPKLNELGGAFEAGYGNYDAYSARGAVNVPLSDNLAFRIAGVSSKSDGYINNPNGGHLNNNQNWGVKGQLLFQPTEGINIRLIGDYAKTTGDCCYGVVIREVGPLQPLINALTLANGLTPPSTTPSDRQGVINPMTTNRVRDYGGTLKIDVDLGGGKLSSITALRRFKVFQFQDGDFSGANVLSLNEAFESKFFSQELTYAGKLQGALKADYVLGAFYSNENLAMGRDLFWGPQAQTFWDAFFGASGVPAGTAKAAPGLFSQEVMGGTAKSYAAFTHWDVKLGEALDLILGARVSRENKTGNFNPAYFRDRLFDPLALAGIMPGTAYAGSTGETSVSGTAGLQYRFNRAATAYLTYNRGYKAGGVNLDVNAKGLPGSLVLGSPGVAQSPLYKPETVDGVELGTKVDWLDRHARTNVAVFYNKIHDLQVAEFLGLQFLIVNAPSAEVYGFEIEQTYKVNQAVTLNAAATWLPQAEFGNSSVLGPLLSGRRLSSAPKLAGNFSVDVDQPISASFAVIGRVQVDYTGSSYTNSTNNLSQGAVALVDANIGLKSLKNGWRIEGWVRNLFDTTYVTADFNVPLQGSAKSAYIGAPRIYGVRLRGSF